MKISWSSDRPVKAVFLKKLNNWVLWTLVTWFRNYERLKFGRYRMNDSNNRQNNGLLESCSRLQSMLEKCIIKDFWISWTLVTWLRIYKPLPFGSFTPVDAISDQRPELSAEEQIAEKLFQNLVNAKNV